MLKHTICIDTPHTLHRERTQHVIFIMQMACVRWDIPSSCSPQYALSRYVCVYVYIYTLAVYIYIYTLAIKLRGSSVTTVQRRGTESSMSGRGKGFCLSCSFQMGSEDNPACRPNMYHGVLPRG
jgi:hypothetical protein